MDYNTTRLYFHQDVLSGPVYVKLPRKQKKRLKKFMLSKRLPETEESREFTKRLKEAVKRITDEQVDAYFKTVDSSYPFNTLPACTQQLSS